MIKEPKIYIKHSWENRKGFKYKQPVNYCNNVRLTYETIANFENIFGEPFAKVQKESNAYNKALNESNYKSDLWKNEKARDLAFNKIFDFNISGKSGTGSSTTPLLPFEIYMMNDGFEMVSFCELNAINPGVSIVAKKQDGTTFTKPKSLKYSRCYKKADYFIYIAFGIKINNRKTNFYFKTNKSNCYFQVDNDFSNYEKAIYPN
jgi:hypothetical protein